MIGNTLSGFGPFSKVHPKPIAPCLSRGALGPRVVWPNQAWCHQPPTFTYLGLLVSPLLSLVDHNHPVFKLFISLLCSFLPPPSSSFSPSQFLFRNPQIHGWEGLDLPLRFQLHFPPREEIEPTNLLVSMLEYCEPQILEPLAILPLVKRDKGSGGGHDVWFGRTWI